MKNNKRVEDVRLIRNGIIRVAGRQFAIPEPEDRLALGQRAFIKWDPKFPSKIDVFDLWEDRLVCIAYEARG